LIDGFAVCLVGVSLTCIRSDKSITIYPYLGGFV
jgi:hypothetical protein